MAPSIKRSRTPTEIADAERLMAAWKAYQQRCREKGESPTQEWLGSVTGIGNQSAVGQYLRGVIPLNLNALVAICRAIGAEPAEISPTLAAPLRDVLHPQGNGKRNSLPFGGGFSTRTEAYNQPTTGDNFESGPDLRNRRYPEISWVQAGMWTESAENIALGEVADWHYCPYDLGERGYVLRVKGISMTAPPESRHSFPEGTLLFVNADADPEPGKFVIVSREHGQEATFKKLVQIEGDLYLEALNPAWPKRHQELTKEHRFQGVVVFSGQRL